jgi:AraC-like DNA-binding protein
MSETQLLRAHRAVRLLSERQLQHIRSFIDRNIDKDVSVSHLSSELTMSISHFSHCFKATLGISPHAFVARCKILASAKLVIDTDCSLEEIAEKIGFSNLGHFRRQFQKSFGCNPSDLRIAAGIGPDYAATILGSLIELRRASASNLSLTAGESSSVSQDGQTEGKSPGTLTFK